MNINIQLQNKYIRVFDPGKNCTTFYRLNISVQNRALKTPPKEIVQISKKAVKIL